MDTLIRAGWFGLLLFGAIFLATAAGWAIITLWYVSPLIVLSLGGFIALWRYTRH